MIRKCKVLARKTCQVQNRYRVKHRESEDGGYDGQIGRTEPEY